MITIDLTKTKITDKDIKSLDTKIAEAHKRLRLVDGTIENGWVNLPSVMTASDELKRMTEKATWVRANSDVMAVIGIGGSYAGAAAGLEMVGSDFPIEFLGTSFDPRPITAFIKKWRDKRICVNVISKSGTTLEIMAAFNIIDKLMREKYSDDEYKKRVIITTDTKKGYLREFADKYNLETFAVPDFVGGRFSALSAVGLFPLAVGGMDINAVLYGATMAAADCGGATATNNCAKTCTKPEATNPNINCEAYKYAAARFILYNSGKSTEVITSFHDGTNALLQWWQQLFGESEGKQGRGLYPAPLIYSRDLHSMGQYIQQGTPLLFETIINYEETNDDIKFNPTTDNATRVPAKSFTELNQAVLLGTTKAHANAGVPVITINLKKPDAAGFGYIIYFFETACAMSAYLLDVNPFDQPGVEDYKREMRNLLK